MRAAMTAARRQAVQRAILPLEFFLRDAFMAGLQILFTGRTSIGDGELFRMFMVPFGTAALIWPAMQLKVRHLT
jgi:hypothetical protein